MNVQQIQPKFVEKVWGSTSLEPWFSNPAAKIGEVWFPAGELLIKFLFTTEHLSVQVHPDDEYARENENSRGKTEMWHILRAEPDSQVALGFKAPLDRGQLRSLCTSGAVMDQLGWQTAKPGDTFFTPAGTVHAIGAGLALCEIQENSDVTYRMFDYGRPRELHLDRAFEVADLGGHEGAAKPRPVSSGREELVRCDHFVTEKWRLSESTDIGPDQFVIMLEGKGTIAGQSFQPGTVWAVGPEPATIAPESEAVLLITRV